jgi:hypothetical protein
VPRPPTSPRQLVLLVTLALVVSYVDRGKLATAGPLLRRAWHRQLERCPRRTGEERRRLGDAPLHFSPSSFGQTIRPMSDHAHGEARFGGMGEGLHRRGHQ